MQVSQSPLHWLRFAYNLRYRYTHLHACILRYQQRGDPVGTTLKLMGEFVAHGAKRPSEIEVPVQSGMSRESALQIALNMVTARGYMNLKRLFIAEIPVTNPYSGNEMCTLWTVKKQWSRDAQCDKWWNTLMRELAG